MEIKDVMTTHPKSCPPGASLVQVARMMRDEDIGEVPIVAGDGSCRLLGVVTDRDIAVRAVAAGRNPETVRAEDCMTAPATTCSEGASLDDCVNRMASERIRRMPIVNAEGELCGILAQSDLQATDARSLKEHLGDRVSTPH